MLLFLFAYAIHSEDNCWEVDYGFSVDAGSSGTRLYLYAWNISFQYPIPGLVFECSTNKPLFTAYYDNTTVKTVFDDLLECAKINEKQSETLKSCPLNKAKTDFYVYFTTSVRILEPTEQTLIINQTYDYLKKTEYNVSMNMLDVLSPDEEGIYTWITVNLLKKTLVDSSKTIPVASMGSSSVQVVFSSANSEEKFEGNTYIVNINNINHTLFCLHNNHLGIDSGLFNHTRSIAQIVGKSSVDTPCYNKGHQSIIGQINILGNGSSKHCTSLLAQYTLKGNRENNANSYFSFDGVEMPHALDKGTVYATSVFAYAADFFNWSSTMTLLEQFQFTEKFCSLSEDAIIEEYGDDKHLTSYCAQMAFTNYYLNSGLGIPNSTHVERASKIDEIELNYIYGAILARANGKLEIKIAPKKFPKVIAIVIAVVCGVVLIGVIVFIVMKVRKARIEKDEKGEKEMREKLITERNQMELENVCTIENAETL